MKTYKSEQTTTKIRKEVSERLNRIQGLLQQQTGKRVLKQDVLEQAVAMFESSLTKGIAC